MRVSNQSDRAKQLCREASERRKNAIFFPCTRAKSTRTHQSNPTSEKANRNVKLKKRRRHCTSSNNRVRAQDLFAWSAFHFLCRITYWKDTLGAVCASNGLQNIASSGTQQSISIRPRFTWNKSTDSPAKLCSRFYYSNRYILFVIAFFSLSSFGFILNCGRRMHHILARRLIKWRCSANIIREFQLCNASWFNSTHARCFTPDMVRRSR